MNGWSGGRTSFRISKWMKDTLSEPANKWYDLLEWAVVTLPTVRKNVSQSLNVPIREAGSPGGVAVGHDIVVQVPVGGRRATIKGGSALGGRASHTSAVGFGTSLINIVCITVSQH
jgi:hypothetical protein